MECSICFKLGRLVKFIQLGDLKQSGKSEKCRECKLLWEALLLRKSNYTESEFAGHVQLHFAPDSPLLLHGPVALDVSPKYSDSGPHHPTTGPAKDVESHLPAPSCLAQDSSWLQDCLASHLTCKQASNMRLPTRVIEFGTAGLREPFLLCWGDPSVHPVMKTTRETLVAHEPSIAHGGMSATLRDAVTITSRLGIQYFWIDALCIIQGDPDDWAREAGQMCEVYSNAVNSIRIFAPRAFEIPPQQLELNGRPVYVRDSLKRKHNDVPILLRVFEIEDNHAKPINKSAWTLQEAILSSRTLRYTSNELLDEGPLRCLRSPALFQEMLTTRAYLQWRQILQLFMEHFISYDEDRLPALSHMSTQFGLLYEGANGRKDRYHRNHGTRSGWAAVEGPVMFHPVSHFKQDVELLEMHVEPLTKEDLFGQVREDAKLVMRGTLIHKLKIASKTAKPGDLRMGFVAGITTPSFGTTHHLFQPRPTRANTHPYHRFLILKRSSQDTNVFRRVAVSLCRSVLDTKQEMRMVKDAEGEVPNHV
ncbi:hypothetical protein LZ32DRAFT_632446 [Colletotrichum eremochloae]|nr:hypothetical protein LZ32DRAFT_632446 [Colletotrichum eremochloae]